MVAAKVVLLMIFYAHCRLVIHCYLSFRWRMGSMVQWLQLLVLSKVLVFFAVHCTYSAIIALKTSIYPKVTHCLVRLWGMKAQSVKNVIIMDLV